MRFFAKLFEDVWQGFDVVSREFHNWDSLRSCSRVYNRDSVQVCAQMVNSRFFIHHVHRGRKEGVRDMRSPGNIKMDSPLFSIFFGPLSNDYCSLFSFYSVFFLFMVIFHVAALLYILISTSKTFSGSGSSIIIFNIYLVLLYLLFYFQNRLFYNICLSNTTKKNIWAFI